MDIGHVSPVEFRNTGPGQTSGDAAKGLTMIGSEYTVVQNVFFCLTTVALKDKSMFVYVLSLSFVAEFPTQFLHDLGRFFSLIPLGLVTH